jgi:hypothetical protein
MKSPRGRGPQNGPKKTSKRKRSGKGRPELRAFLQRSVGPVDQRLSTQSGSVQTFIAEQSPHAERDVHEMEKSKSVDQLEEPAADESRPV